jgi:uncharacterized membrane protein
MVFAVIGIFIPVSYKITISIIAMIILFTTTVLLIIKKIGAYSAICMLLASVMIISSMLTSYLFFDKDKNRKNDAGCCETFVLQHLCYFNNFCGESGKDGSRKYA